jgi:hypothetical protein
VVHRLEEVRAARQGPVGLRKMKTKTAYELWFEEAQDDAVAMVLMSAPMLAAAQTAGVSFHPRANWPRCQSTTEATLAQMRSSLTFYRRHYCRCALPEDSQVPSGRQCWRRCAWRGEQDGDVEDVQARSYM